METAIMYNKHTPVIELDLDGCKVIKVRRLINPEYLPLGLPASSEPEKFTKWITKRKIPESREGLMVARRDFPGFEAYRHMFSLSDQYWFSYREGDIWDSLNFFTNRYDPRVGKVFFTPWEVDPEEAFGESPDLTTNGALRKRWKQSKDGTSWLIKAGSKTLNQEPISEVLATMLLRKLQIIPFVEYELVIDGMRLCSRCRNFIGPDTEFVPAIHIYQKEPRRKDETIYAHLLKMCVLHGVYGAKEYVDNMIAVDRIIGNKDRHLGNFGFIRDVNTLQITGFAPLFDSGYAFTEEAQGAIKESKFARQEPEALRKMLRRIKTSAFLDHQDMFTLIDQYPELDKNQKQVIKDKIAAAEKEMRGLIKDFERISPALEIGR